VIVIMSSDTVCIRCDPFTFVNDTGGQTRMFLFFSDDLRWM
jgi:hypothetical protein